MARADSDRNLLFGVLALQMDFITREALVAAVAAWVLDKARPLDAILVEQGALSAARRAMLEPLVGEHVKAHGDDPERSLASVSSIGSVRDDLARITDPDVAASLDRVGTLATRAGLDDGPSTRAGDDLETRAPSVGTATSSGLRFRVVRPHDKGGLGIVSVARDMELGREVALKEIQDHHADDPEKRSRFVLEAEVTGGLEHPGIVPVYGLGHYEDGRPFYAMRFIRGDSLKHAIARFHEAEAPGRDPGARAVQLRELLGRFVDVCDAVAYAHSRGVLHRDLKPGNIMLGPFGETLVVDWGLAKTLAEGETSTGPAEQVLRPSTSGASSATIMGSAVGTPAYMPPEQAEGRLDRLGPPSDVYSLGATLYHLLTGRVPFEEREIGELLRKVVRGEFPPPRRANPNVPPALDAICRKAMARDPGGRYGSPTALASDLKAWLAGEPVTAYCEPWRDRAARWARRHRTAVAGAASLMATAVVALAVGLALVRVEQARTRVQRDLAARNFRDAREAADGFLTRITDDPQLALPGLQPLRKRLLEAGLSYYQGFARQGVDPGDHARLADAYARVGRINSLVGSSERAREDYAEALAFAEKAARARPDDPAARLFLAERHDGLGQVQLATNRMPEALRSFDQSLEIARRLAADRPGDPEALRALAQVHADLGAWHGRAGDRPRAIEQHRSALAIHDRLAPGGRGSPRARADLARAIANLGVAQADSRMFDQALPAFIRAREIREALRSEAPGDSDNLGQLATVHHHLAAIQIADRRLDEARTSLERARDLREELIASNSVTTYQEDLAKDYEDLGGLHRGLKDLDEAMRCQEKSRDIRAQLVRFHRSVSTFRFGLANSWVGIGLIQAARGRGTEARKSYETSREILEGLIREDRTQAMPRLQLASVRDQIGTMKLGVDIRPDEAMASLVEARRIREELHREQPKDVQFVAALSNSYCNIGSHYDKTGRSAEAIGLFREAVKLRREALADLPDDFNNRKSLGSIFYNVALMEKKAGHPVEAMAAYQQAIDEMTWAIEKAPKDEGTRKSLGFAYESLGQIERSQGLADRAVATALDRRKRWPDSPEELLKSARELAACLPLPGLTEPERVRENATQTLRRAVELGLKDPLRLREDKALDPLRDYEGFRQLVGEWKKDAPTAAASDPKPTP